MAEPILPGQPKPPVKRDPGQLTKVIVLIALVVLLIVGILIPIKLVPNAFSSLSNRISNIFRWSPRVTLSTEPTDIRNGVPFTLSWGGATRTNGSYSLTYDCTEGVRLETSIVQQYEPISCNVPYFFSAQENKIPLTLYSDVKNVSDVPFTLSFLANDSSEATTIGTTVLTVTNSTIGQVPPVATTTPPAPSTGGQATSTQPKPKPKPTTPSSGTITRQNRVSNPNGTPDLVVRVLARGYINRVTGVFTPASSLPSNQPAAIKFEVANFGDKNTGTWTFHADLPSQTNPSYDSPVQQNLGPGDSIVYTLAFENLNPNQVNRLNLFVDPKNYIYERSEANNNISVDIFNTNYSNGVISGGTIIVGTQGRADLTITQLQTGIIERSSNLFYSTQYFDADDRAGVRFTVKNIGDRESGSWTYRIDYPSSYNSNYLSDRQISLRPGEQATFTFGFDNAQSGNINIYVDSNNEVTELREDNNFRYTTVRNFDYDYNY